jgi:hypothetical protein
MVQVAVGLYMYHADTGRFLRFALYLNLYCTVPPGGPKAQICIRYNTNYYSKVLP